MNGLLKDSKHGKLFTDRITKELYIVDNEGSRWTIDVWLSRYQGKTIEITVEEI